MNHQGLCTATFVALKDTIFKNFFVGCDLYLQFIEALARDREKKKNKRLVTPYPTALSSAVCGNLQFNCSPAEVAESRRSFVATDIWTEDVEHTLTGWKEPVNIEGPTATKSWASWKCLISDSTNIRQPSCKNSTLELLWIRRNKLTKVDVFDATTEKKKTLPLPLTGLWTRSSWLGTRSSSVWLHRLGTTCGTLH